MIYMLFKKKKIIIIKNKQMKVIVVISYIYINKLFFLNLYRYE